MPHTDNIASRRMPLLHRSRHPYGHKGATLFRNTKTLLPEADSPSASWRLDRGGGRRRCSADGRRGVVSKRSASTPRLLSRYLASRSRPSVFACGSDISPIELGRGVLLTSNAPPQSTARSASLRLDWGATLFRNITTLLPKADSPSASWRLDWGGGRRRCSADGRRGGSSSLIPPKPTGVSSGEDHGMSILSTPLFWTLAYSGPLVVDCGEALRAPKSYATAVSRRWGAKFENIHAPTSRLRNSMLWFHEMRFARLPRPQPQLPIL